ncbi:MAG TPA: hypothetical protein VMU11_03415 [Verrucomicrobiae bacterium]|nr:hypothetical protein [Verrucomicrobiae bacterium]
MKNLFMKPFFLGAALVVALSGLTSILPASADRDAWSWTDASATLPQRDGVTLFLSAELQGSWLVSDGRHLWREDGTRLTNLTQTALDHGATSIKLLASDGRQWLVWNKGLADSRGQLWLLDGTDWTDLTDVLPPTVESLEIAGHDGQWYLKTTAHGATRVVFVNGTASIPQDVVLPLESSGDGHATFVNGRWFWLGEQAGRLAVWTMDGTTLKAVKNVPAAMHVSKIWSADGAVLVATSNTPNNASLVDGLWVFDGSNWTDLSSQAKALGLTPADAGSLKAAMGGASWMIVSGNSLFRYDGYALASKGQTKNRVSVVAGGNGFLVAGTDTNGSATLQLVDDAMAAAQVAPAPISNTNVTAIANGVSIPTLVKDASTGISYAAWTVPEGASLPSGSAVSYRVAAQDKTDGLSSIELWVNGVIVKTCSLNGTANQTTCDVTLSATDYPVGTSLFMNARVSDAKGNAFWIPAKTLTRPAPVATNNSGATTTAASATSTAPVFASRLELLPNVTDIRRGGTLTVRTLSQDNLNGLDRVEISYGGQVRQICRYGVAMSEVKCDLTIDTATFADNTQLSFVARAINTDGQEAWSNGQTVTIRGVNWSPTPAGAAQTANGVTQWSWLTPPTAQIEATQETVYNVGAWSANGIAKIEMVVNGAVRKTCSFVSGNDTRACAYTIRTGDWDHGQLVTVNARITDMQGRTAWSDASSVTISRAWWEPLNTPGAYVTAAASKTDTFSTGDTLSFVLTGWSPNGVDHIELYLNGSRVTSCPSDMCRYTTAPLSGDKLEYQARLVDDQGKETWTSLEGLNKK